MSQVEGMGPTMAPVSISSLRSLQQQESQHMSRYIGKARKQCGEHRASAEHIRYRYNV